MKNAVVHRASCQRHEVPEDVITMPVTGGVAKELQELRFVLLWCECQG
jgi:hypothetical protein